MNTYLGAANELSAEDVDPEIIAAAEVVYLEGYLFDVAKARGAFRKAVDAARAAGRRTAITLAETFLVETWRDDLLAFIDSGVDIVFANEHEAEALFQCDLGAAVEALRRRTQIAAVTRGAKGSIIVSGDQTVEVPADAIDRVVDTTGAGDQYAAGFLFGLSHGRSLAECGRLGSMAAAEVISHYGPRPQTPLAQLGREKGLV
jgi:sugar/nucleoside kinase (ribokinase family)